MSPTNSAAERPITLLDVRTVGGAAGDPDVARSLEPHGFRVIAVWLHPPDHPEIDALILAAETAGMRGIAIPDRGGWDWSAVRQLGRLCREERAAIWHSHDNRSHFLGVLVRCQRPLKLVATIRGWEGTESLSDAFGRWMLPWFDRVICVSDDLVETCLHHGIRQDRLRLLTDGGGERLQKVYEDVLSEAQRRADSG